MCGIAAYTGTRPARPLLLKALKTLEYRGYDSAGIALAHKGKLQRCRVKGDLAHLEKALKTKPLLGRSGIGHTRWATHGSPSTKNAHPHKLGGIALVHNGIIENHRALQETLGVEPASDTDSELIIHQIAYFLREGLPPAEAFRLAIQKLEGSFAIAALFESAPDKIFAAQQASPLVIGKGTSGFYLASDPLALDKEVEHIAFLKDGDIASISPENAEITNFLGKKQNRVFTPRLLEDASISKGGHKHFMGREIHEQPASLARAFEAFFISTKARPFPGYKDSIKQVMLVACGSAAYATRMGAYWLEKFTSLPAHAEVASEFRYRKPVIPANTLMVFISQSGETADTLAAMRHAQAEGHKTTALVNRRQSTLAREADEVLFMEAGPEIGVGATKTLSAQIMAMAAMTLAIARQRKTMPAKEVAMHVAALEKIPAQLNAMLRYRPAIRQVAHQQLAAKKRPPYVLYLGRGIYYPIALEGALKCKEISYIQAEAYPAGEMKHGPLALVTSQVPIVAIAPDDALFPKTLANLEEVKARGGKIILITGKKGKQQSGHLAPEELIILPETASEFARALLAVLPVQLLAYETAHRLGLNVDRPRNLAKSVTVE